MTKLILKCGLRSIYAVAFSQSLSGLCRSSRSRVPTGFLGLRAQIYRLETGGPLVGRLGRQVKFVKSDVRIEFLAILEILGYFGPVFSYLSHASSYCLHLSFVPFVVCEAGSRRRSH